MLIESFRKFVSDKESNKNKKTVSKAVFAKNTYYYADVLTVPTTSQTAISTDSGGV